MEDVSTSSRLCEYHAAQRPVWANIAVSFTLKIFQGVVHSSLTCLTSGFLAIFLLIFPCSWELKPTPSKVASFLGSFFWHRNLGDRLAAAIAGSFSSCCFPVCFVLIAAESFHLPLRTLQCSRAFIPIEYVKLSETYALPLWGVIVCCCVGEWQPQGDNVMVCRRIVARLQSALITPQKSCMTS